MFGIEARLDAQCPQCAKDTVYDEKLVTRPGDHEDDDGGNIEHRREGGSVRACS